MEELNGEKIDIIPWTENQEEYIKIALAPAKIAFIKLNEDEKRSACYVNPDQRPLAIGKNGQNVRLASHLTGWEIDIMDIGELGEQPQTPEQLAEAEEKAKTIGIEELGLSKEIQEKLKTANLTLIEQLKGLSAKDLQAVEGIDEKEAKEIAEAVKKVK
jgi:N utilization substance protein A